MDSVEAAMHEPAITRASLLGRVCSPAPGEAWVDFVRIYGSPVHRWCREHGLQPADAADVAQEVLVRFWRQSSRFRYQPGATFRGYLQSIVRGAVADWYSAQPKARSGAARSRPIEHLAHLPARNDLVARLEQAFDTELVSMAMQEVRERVQPHTWRAFHRQVFDQCPGVDVAAELGVDVNVVYVARHKVTRMIRETVKRMEGADDSNHAA